MACLKALEGDIGEIKRMYVRPEYRGQGIGRALLEQLFDEALDIGYVKLRLDSALFMKEAHQLYRAMGFKATAPYPGSEILPEYHSFWVFMEKSLINPEI